VAKAFTGTGQRFKGRKVPLKRIRPPAGTKARNAPRAAISPVPVFGWAPQTGRDIKRFFTLYPKRMVKGRALFLLALADVLREEVRARAPSLGTIPYAEQLQIALLEGVDVGEGVAVYFEGQPEGLTEQQVGTTLLFVVPRPGARPFVEVLAKYSPWPPDWLPIRPDPQDATLVARAARPDEVAYFVAERRREADLIESSLRAMGVINAKVEPPGEGVGAEVHQDVAWAVLRAEFGLGGGEGKAHWRPALEALGKAIPKLLKAYVRYVETGRWTGHSLPEVDSLGISDLGGAAEAFTRRIAPFAPRRKF
jgi:hypothetical protein